MSGAVIKEGYLVKSPPLTKTVASWKRRYFKLFESGRLDYYEAQRDSMAKGIVNLLDCSVIEVVGKFNGRNHCLRLVTPQRTFILQCRNQTEMRNWHEKIKSTRDQAAGDTGTVHTAGQDNAFQADSSPSSSLGRLSQYPHGATHNIPHTFSAPQLSHSNDALDQLQQRPSSTSMHPRLSDSSLGTLTSQSLPYQNVTSELRSGLTPPPSSRFQRSYSPQPAKHRPYVPGEVDDGIKPSDSHKVHASTVSSLDFSYGSDFGRTAAQPHDLSSNIRGPGFMSSTSAGSTWSPTSSYMHPTATDSPNGYSVNKHDTLTRTDSAGYVPMAAPPDANGIADDYEYAADIHYSPSRMKVCDDMLEIKLAEFEVPEDYQRFERIGPQPGINSSLGRPSNTTFPPEVPSRQKRQVPTLPPHQSQMIDGSGYCSTPPPGRGEVKTRKIHQFV